MLSDMLTIDSLLPIMPERAAAPQGGWVVGKYGACETATEASDDAMQAWKERFKRTHLPSGNHARGCGPSFCNLYENLYNYDRCWNPRHVCTVSVGQGGPQTATLVVAQRDAESPAGRELRAGGYLTVLGPAAAFGVGATTQKFASQLA